MPLTIQDKVHLVGKRYSVQSKIRTHREGRKERAQTAGRERSQSVSLAKKFQKSRPMSGHSSQGLGVLSDRGPSTSRINGTFVSLTGDQYKA